MVSASALLGRGLCLFAALSSRVFFRHPGNPAARISLSLLILIKSRYMYTDSPLHLMLYALPLPKAGDPP
jgi:hypothetical protein